MSSPLNNHDPGDEGREITILYATETGNAQDVAERLARFCRRLRFAVRVYSIDEYSMADILSEALVIFMVSTAGTGKEPRSMTPFWTMLLRSDLPNDLFDHLEYAIFGMGDSAYEKFCWPAKLLSRRLSSLGATEIVGRGEADDQHHLGLDGAFEPWLLTLSEKLLELYPLPPGVEILPDTVPQPRVSVSDGPVLEPGIPVSIPEEYHSATVSANKRITAEDWYQDVRHFEFEFNEDLHYAPGDIAVISPEASAADLESFLVQMGWSNTADEAFTIRHTQLDQSLPVNLPSTLTLRTLFTRHLDINAVPRRSFFALLRHFTADNVETEKLDELLTPEYALDLYDYCQSVRRTIREVLEEFRSAKIPREYLFDLFPPLRPREFSIASSKLKNPRRIELCVAIVRYKTKLKMPRRGVATTYLAALQPGDRIALRIKKGLLALPMKKHTPIICVGPGTGIAPVRSLIQERTTLGSYHNTLYQGCRHATKDQHYSKEFSALANEGKMVYRVAHSRDGPPGVKRTYVQDLILQDAKRVWKLIGEQGAWVYISGSSNKMPAGVRAALAEAVRQQAGKPEDEAKEFVTAMEREGRLIEDCWE